MKFTSPVIQEEYLLHASPEFVYNDIRELFLSRKSRFDDILPKDLGRKLLDRKEPLINLVLAEYSNDDDLLKELFDSGNKAARIAVLSNTNENFFPKGRKWLSEEYLQSICDDSNEASAFFGNKILCGRELETVFLKTGFYSELPHDLWIDIVYHALHNPNVTKRKAVDYYATDGWAEYEDTLPRSAAWSLLDTLEVTFKNTTLLYYAFYETGIPFELPAVVKKDENTDYSAKIEKETLRFFQRVIDRWSARNCKENLAYDSDGEESFYFKALREGIASSAPIYRKSILEFLKTHTDIYVRRGYYRVFSPSKAEEIEELFKLDGKHFLESAILNQNLYRTKPLNIRKAFERIVYFSGDDNQTIEFEDRQRIREIYDRKAQELSSDNPQLYCKDPDDYVDIKMTDGAIASSSLNAVQQIYDNISEMSKNMIAKKTPQSDLPELLSMISKLQRDSMDAVLTRIDLLEKRFKQVLIWFAIAFVVLCFISRR